MSFNIVTDSCCNLTAEDVVAFDLTILPLTYYVDGVSYVNDPLNPAVNLAAFYGDMREGKVVSTSLPKLGDSQEKLTKLLDAGNDILYLGFSSALSGTFEATRTLMESLKADYPERTLVAIDTLAAAGGQGIIVWAAAKMRQEGKSLEEVAEWVNNNLLRISHWFTVDDLTYLFRGGRLSKTSAWAGTLLNIKPVLHVDQEGRLVPIEKVRGRKKSLMACVNMMEKLGYNADSELPIIINHGDCREDAEFVREEIEKRYGEHHFIISELDPVIGAHTGPGIIALFFEANER